jgi:hypothetical protein
MPDKPRGLHIRPHDLADGWFAVWLDDELGNVFETWAGAERALNYWQSLLDAGKEINWYVPSAPYNLDEKLAEIETLRAEVKKKYPTRTGGKGGKAPRMPNIWFFYAVYIANGWINTNSNPKPADLARKIEKEWRPGWPERPTFRTLETFASRFLEAWKITSET